MMQSRLQMIQRFKTEKELRERLLSPLFERMRFQAVNNHGPNEFGKDFVLKKRDDFDVKRYFGIVVKKGNINIGSSKKSDSILLTDISRQIRECYEIDYNDTDEKRIVKIDKVYFICDGTISDNAKKEIVQIWGSSRDLYEKNTEFISGDRLVSLVENNWPYFFLSYSPEFSEYADHLLESIEKEDKSKAININEEIKEVSSRYIHCNLYEVFHERDGKIKYVVRNPDNVFSETRKILIVGDSGTGKSYLLRKQIRRDLLSETEGGGDPRLKILIKASDLSNLELNIETIDAFILDEVSKVWPSASEKYTRPFVENRKIDFYFDGFDEISTDNRRHTARENIVFLNKYFLSSKMVITTRQLTPFLTQEFPETFKRFDMRQLSYNESIRYLQEIIKGSNNKAEDILSDIKQQEIMLVLPRTPLTLNLISSLFCENAKKELPSNITEVYKIFSEIMLGRWDNQRDVTNAFDYEQKISLLGEIANYMQNNLLEHIQYDKAVELAENFLSDIGDKKKKGVALLDEIINRSELLFVANSDLHIKFKHRSFQEYFVAYKIHTQGLDFQEFAKLATDPWWEGVIIYLCGFRKKANDIVRFVAQLDLDGPEGNEILKFRRGKSLGFMVRAGYQTSVDEKLICINTSLNDFESCYHSKDIKKRFQEYLGKTPNDYSIHLILQLILSAAYYSKLTRTAVFRAIEENPSPMQLSFLTKLVADFEDKEKIDEIGEKVRLLNDSNVKMACFLVAEQFSRKDLKLLEIKSFRKLKKAAFSMLKEQFKIH